MGLDVGLTGLGDLIDTLESMVDNASRVEDEALQAAADIILKDAEQTTAFIDRTGRLRKSLSKSKVKRKKTGKFVLVGALSEDVFYARYVEYGTSRADAHPFLMPAYERHKNEVTKEMADKLREALKSI